MRLGFPSQPSPGRNEIDGGVNSIIQSGIPSVTASWIGLGDVLSNGSYACKSSSVAG